MVDLSRAAFVRCSSVAPTSSQLESPSKSSSSVLGPGVFLPVLLFHYNMTIEHKQICHRQKRENMEDIKEGNKIWT